MKVHGNISRLLLLLTALAALILTDIAAAQDFIGQFPFAPPMASPMVRGRFYFQGGVRYRNIQKFEFSQQAHVVRYDDPGVPPFGPFTDGPFGTQAGRPGFDSAVAAFTNLEEGFPRTPTYNSTQEPRRSGYWYYDDGYIIADWGAALDPNAFRWPNAIGGFDLLGQFESAAHDLYVGHFWVPTPSAQANSGVFNTTTTITWQYVIDGNYDARFGVAAGTPSGEVASQIFQANYQVWAEPKQSYQVWSPNFEVGFQYTNLFDFFYSFSWFGLSHTLARSSEAASEFSRRGFRDTFSFTSTNTNAWVPFESYLVIVGDGSQANFQIYPDTTGPGGLPTRTFFEQVSATAAPEIFHEDITHRADVTVYENRYGARSWAPLYGMGRFGAYLGISVSPIYFNVAGSRLVTSLGPTLPVGTVVEAVAEQKNDWWWNFGGFAGMDLELDYLGWFVKGGVDYSLCTTQKFQILAVETQFNPGGLNIAIGGGFHF